jgi:hypothetical protein
LLDSSGLVEELLKQPAELGIGGQILAVIAQSDIQKVPLQQTGGWGIECTDATTIW